jgi:hypothetical protein
MSTRNAKGYTPPSRAELQAMRDLKQQNVPNGEAGRREQKLLQHYSAAQDDLQWIVDNNAHVDLGFETFTEWYKARVLPAVKAAGLRPTPEFALYVLDRVLADDGIKPAAQKHIHRELAEITGLSDHALRRALQDRSERRNDAGADLEEATGAFDAKYSKAAAADAPEDAADGGEGALTAPEDPSASGPSVPPPVDGPDVTPEDTLAAASSHTNDQVALVAGQQPGPDSSPETGEAPAGGDRNGHRAGADPAAIATTYRPGIDHPLPQVGEARAGAELLGAGGMPSSGLGEGAGGDEVEGEPAHSPSTDPAHVVEVFTEWADWVDGYDSEAIGPLLTDEQLDKLHSAVDLLAQFVGKLERSRTP